MDPILNSSYDPSILLLMSYKKTPTMTKERENSITIIINKIKGKNKLNFIKQSNTLL